MAASDAAAAPTAGASDDRFEGVPLMDIGAEAPGRVDDGSVGSASSSRKRRAPATASPEPAAPGASAPAERPKKRPKRAWTPAEDDKLRAAREKSISLNQGEVVWKDVAAEVDTRNAKQCRERYANHHDPTIKKGKFSDGEDAHLLALSESDLPRGPRGIDWERVAASLPTVDGRRKGPDVKNRYHTLKKRKPPATPMSL